MKIGDCFLEVKDGEAIVTNGEGKSVTISEHEVWKQLDSLLRKENELEDIKGQKFGDFTAIERVRVYPYGFANATPGTNANLALHV